MVAVFCVSVKEGIDRGLNKKNYFQHLTLDPPQVKIDIHAQ